MAHCLFLVIFVFSPFSLFFSFFRFVFVLCVFVFLYFVFCVFVSCVMCHVSFSGEFLGPFVALLDLLLPLLHLTCLLRACAFGVSKLAR